MRALLLLPLLALALAGCAGPTGTAPGPDEDRRLSFRTLEDCQGSAPGELYTVVQTQEAWQALWRERCSGVVGTEAQPPAVDFARNSVVAAFWGEKNQGGYAIEVTDVIERPNEVVVQVRRGTPAEGCAAIQALTYPSHLVVTERLSKPARFEFTDATVPC